jgi:hypothetical protein
LTIPTFTFMIKAGYLLGSFGQDRPVKRAKIKA